MRVREPLATGFPVSLQENIPSSGCSKTGEQVLRDRSHAGMIYAGIVEYAAILAAIGGNTFTGLLGFDPSWNVIFIVGGFVFFFWLVVFKL